jgi:hypothetical protein
MAGVSFIMHRGVKILYEDFSSVDNENEAFALLKKGREIIDQQSEKSVLALLNVKDTKFSPTVTKALKEYAKANTPYMKFAAVYGIEGLKEILYRSVITFTGRKNIALFKTLEDAKDFLADYNYKNP